MDIADELSGQQGLGIEVQGPSGATFEVIHIKERQYWDDVVSKYLTDYRFTNISDLQDLDRVVAMELMSYRYSQWAAAETDYWNNGVDTDSLSKSALELSKEIRQLKKGLGIDKSSRDKDSGDSVAAYIDNLRLRAKEFGVVRNEQSVKSITLFQELVALMTLHNNCTEDERKENHVELTDILEWIETVAIPEFQSIDEEFRKTSQKYWIHEI